MARKRKSGLDYWLENCYRCSNFRRCHYLNHGVDDGSVSYQCKLTGEHVAPHRIDGCKKFSVGEPEEVIIEIGKDKGEKNTNG